RSQAIEAPINGRILRWFVAEGSRVAQGDPIAELSDLDPNYLERLQQQRQALLLEQGLHQSKVLAYDLRSQDLQRALTAAVAAASAKADAARAKREGAARELEADLAALETNQQNLERETALEEQGLSSARTLELAQLSYQKSVADVAKDRARLTETESEIRAAVAEQAKAATGAQASLNSARATLEEARVSVQKNRAELVKLDTQLARQANQLIRAPRAGTILKLNGFTETAYAKAGDQLAVLVPDTRERAVALYVNGVDVPLIRAGREVRLQFEGWPALQFSGWPAAAVGTFGGRVAVVDASDDGEGKFRIVVRPGQGESWPDAAYLRQGGRARGWVLLDTVPLGYELWRQFNGFPPTVKDTPAKTESPDVIKRKVKK
ncbi:MAG: transporter, partial [Candidatus Melainabacteria bacterium HGW-Melainabacteria-1]